MSTLVTVVHVVTCVFVVLLVMIQSGKGAEISASFGGSSQTVFGSSGGANFFQKMTYVLAGVFMLTSLTLTVLSGQSKKSIFESLPATAPAAPAQSATTPDASAPAAPPAPTGDAAASK